MALRITAADLEAADRDVRRALRTGDHAGLDVLGYGEVSTVIAVETAAGGFACKRLPPFDTRARYEAYRALFDEYLERLADAGVRVIPSELRPLPANGGVVAYCVQPVVPGERLGPRALVAGDAGTLFERLVDHVLATASPRVGFDAQLANWALDDDGWVYLDVTTPLLRDTAGRDRLDADLFVASLPWVLRPLARHVVVRGVLNRYFEPRGVVLDLLANLHKERLERLVPAFVEIANRRFERPLTVLEVRLRYARDARTWAATLAARRADRLWQLRVRRRPYPFLLPGRIER